MRHLRAPVWTAVRSYSTTRVCLSKIVPFKLADIGEGILKVDVLQVFVKEGDVIQEFDRLCEVQSDKATVEITSRVTGTIQKLYVAKGVVAHVGHVLADIVVESDGGNDAPKASPAAAAPASTAASSATAEKQVGVETSKVLATPATRRIAQENNVNLSLVQATGKGGRVMKEDVMRYLEGTAAPTTVVPQTVAVQQANPPTSFGSVPVFDTVVPIVGIRKAMVRSMTEANNIPSFGASDEIEMSNLIKVRDEMKSLLSQRDKALKLSFMPFFLKAASLALRQFPELNAFTNADCSELLVKGSHNIGFAMDTPTGLVVPNIKNVESKSIYDLAVSMKELIDRGSRGAFAPADLQGGTFTISNIGSIGATYTKPVVFPPQVAIGAIGRMQTVPRFDANDNVVKANIINISWSADHRVVDGATMVRFNNLFKAYVEQPALMLLDAK